ncbi:glycosyltransferase family 9 protein [Methylophilus aquaticus]|uniref:Glycosyltransferase family 9 protein n=1 Tax=Methylophilus aquaticus TaxID=1971610 RepID=A0ABT9JU27_9PROT|nr:glycosyltransferase family 9 protein [Methylophilus aquaticus]MDP8567974.1 glycosyltransferase family 9 protein [Methylophilus aquaticus]
MIRPPSLVQYQDADCFTARLDHTVVHDLPRNASIKRILVIKWGGMGDIVISTAIMEDIRLAFPQAALHLNTMPAWQPLFDHDVRFSRVWCVNLQQKPGRWRAYRQWLKEVVEMQYDLIVDLQTNDKSRGLLTMLRLMGKAPALLLGNHPRFPYTIRQTQQLPQAHSFQIMQQALLSAGIPLRTSSPKLHIAPSSVVVAEQLLALHGLLSKSFAIFLCGSHANGLTKRWGAANYAALVAYCINQGERVVLLGGRDEVEECQAIASQHPWHVVNLCGQTRLLEVPVICAHAKYIVANDTGTAHLAASTRTPMMVICGPTNPLRVKPTGQQVVALQLDVTCKNCYTWQCSHHSCMRQLSPQQLLSYLPTAGVADA